ILAKMNGEHTPVLADALEASLPDLERAIKDSCARYGINPTLLNSKIEHYLSAMEYLNLTWGEDAALSALSELFAPSFKEEDKFLLIVKQWIESSFEFTNKQHAQQVITFNKVQKIM